MSGREWRPGDVAMIRVQGDERDVLGLRDEYGWAHLKGYDSPLSSHSRWTTAALVTVVRPVVAIDPEDDDQVERLWDALLETDVAEVRDMQAALREFANPTPHIAEPQGLGAVVEDAEGHWWSRVGGNTPVPWHHGLRGRRSYADITAVRVLSEGVSS